MHLTGSVYVCGGGSGCVGVWVCVGVCVCVCVCVCVINSSEMLGVIHNCLAVLRTPHIVYGPCPYMHKCVKTL